MKAYILTLFPEMFAGVLNASIMKRAQEQGLLEVHLVNIREFAGDRHGTVDDYPYGGGPGMVMKPEPVYEAIEWIREQTDVCLLYTSRPSNKLIRTFKGYSANFSVEGGANSIS